PATPPETPLLLPGMRTGPSSPARYALPDGGIPLGYRRLDTRGADDLLLDEGLRLLGSRPLWAEDHYYLTENRSHYVHIELIQMENNTQAARAAAILARESGNLSGNPCEPLGTATLCGDPQRSPVGGYYMVFSRGPWAVQGITHDNRTPLEDLWKFAVRTAGELELSL
ncbi:MAG: hypothetical protein HY558_02610, partial [Euryarchaeota archaeon]|nr:hypothetical protein [Euryarchaeota archaeon]